MPHYNPADFIRKYHTNLFRFRCLTLNKPVEKEKKTEQAYCRVNFHSFS